VLKAKGQRLESSSSTTWGWAGRARRSGRALVELATAQQWRRRCRFRYSFSLPAQSKERRAPPTKRPGRRICGTPASFEQDADGYGSSREDYYGSGRDQTGDGEIEIASRRAGPRPDGDVSFTRAAPASTTPDGGTTMTHQSEEAIRTVGVTISDADLITKGEDLAVQAHRA